MHIGILCPAPTGHLSPMTALATGLRKRGHEVTMFAIPDTEEKIRSRGLNFCAIGEKDWPIGSLDPALRPLGDLSGLPVLKYTVELYRRLMVSVCRDAPGALESLGIDALVTDQTERVSGTIAERLGLPFVTICNAGILNRDNSIPPFFTSWEYKKGLRARLSNQFGYQAYDWLTRPLQNTLNSYRKQWGLPPHHILDESFSPLAQISQQIPGFDFPRRLPAHFHYVGPLRDASASTNFPWEKLEDRPLIYASLGTLQNRKKEIFHCIAEACSGLDAQLVLSHGGGMNQEETNQLPGNPLVVPYAPQVELLAKASLCITHAGLNTVLDSLSSGVPMVAIPITHEQLGLAARVKWLGAGDFVHPKILSAPLLREAVNRVLSEPLYTKKARLLQTEIRQAGGVVQAATIIDQAFSMKKPTLKNSDR
jgi:zeaxanthin glucosyltransferase